MADENSQERTQVIALAADVGRALTTHHAQSDMLRNCAEALVHHLDAAFARIWLLNTAGDALELCASAGLYTHLNGRHGHIPIGKFKIGRIAQERMPHLTNAVIGDPRVSDQDWAQREGMVAFAGYPLIVDERVIGVAAIFARQSLSEVTLQALGSVADEIAIGIDRKRAEEALRETEARKNAILESALDCIITIDDQQNIIEWNPAAEKTFGHSRSQALGRCMSELIIPLSLRGAHLHGFGHYLATGEGPILNQRIEVSALHADGHEFPVELSVVPIILHGRPLFTAYLRDITERKQAEKALRESEVRYRTLISATAQIVWTNTPDGEMQGTNADWSAFTGQSEEEYTGYGWSNAVHPDDTQPTIDAWKLSVATHTPFGFEHRLRRHDGVYRHFAIRAVPILEASGSIREWIGVHTDVTERRAAEQERRRAEEALRESEQRYKSLFDYNPDAVFSFDLGGHFLSANAACQTVSGYTPAELLRTTFMPLIVPQDLTRVLGLFSMAAQGQPQTFETTITRKEGDRATLAVTIVPTVVDATIVGVFGIAEDISERKRAEALEREANLRQRAFLREVLASVTESKLLLVDSPDQLPPTLHPVGGIIRLSPDEGLKELRGRTVEAARGAGHSEERQHDLVTAASEAGMNAITHGGGHGTARVFVSGSGTIQVRVEDQGTGITMENLPRAALARGFSTKATLGHGLKMTLETIDRLSLLTGPSGTIVVIEQDRVAPLPAWLSEAVTMMHVSRGETDERDEDC